ncbi:MAG: tyrosine-type recombinase/integrase [Eubacterium sp.]|nr:tyrosine-type recombinase/integrase [Eubacterium sp.]
METVNFSRVHRPATIDSRAAFTYSSHVISPFSYKLKYGVLYSHNYYIEVTDGKRNYYELKTLNGEQIVTDNYNEIQFVCLRQDGCLELPTTVSIVCRTIRKKLKGFENFHFHMLRHTYTSNLLSNGANPKEVQELLGHSDVSTTMNIYAHSSQQAKHESAMLLDKIVS